MNEFLWRIGDTYSGVNNTLNDKCIPDDHFSDSANFSPDFSGSGWMIQREGISKYDSNQRTATTYSGYQGKNEFYYHNGTVIYKASDGTSLDTGVTAAYDSWASFGGKDFYVNGTDRAETSDGASFSANTDIPSGAKYLASANNFLYAAGHEAAKLRWCNLGDETTWPAANELVFNQDENDDIIGLKGVNNYLLVLCDKSFYLVNGYSNIDQNVMYFNKSEGCSAFRSVVATPYGPFWWSRAGIVWMKSPTDLDYPMRRKLAGTLSNLNRAYDAYVHAVWYSRDGFVRFYLFNGTSQTTVNLAVDYYPMYDAFFLQTGAGIQMSASCVAIVSGVENIYAGGYNPTYWYKYSAAALTDDSTAITAYFKTKREGSPLVDRNGGRVVVTTNLSGTETITYSDFVNNATSATDTYETSTLTTDVDHEYLIKRKNNRIMHYVSTASTATRTKIISLTHSGQTNKART